MARPRNADPVRTRSAILGAAMRAFGEQGAGPTTVRDVAAAAGVTLATVHHHFGSKADLHRACLDAMYIELRELQIELEQAFLRATGPEVLDEAIVTSFRFARRHRAANRLAIREVLDTGGELPENIRQTLLLPFLAKGSALLHRTFGLPRDEARLVLQTLIYTVARYAATSDRELELISREPDDAPSPASSLRSAEAIPRLEAHLVRVARALVQGGSP